jgi:hypothetical protein
MAKQRPSNAFVDINLMLRQPYSEVRDMPATRLPAVPLMRQSLSLPRPLQPATRNPELLTRNQVSAGLLMRQPNFQTFKCW